MIYLGTGAKFCCQTYSVHLENNLHFCTKTIGNVKANVESDQTEIQDIQQAIVLQYQSHS